MPDDEQEAESDKLGAMMRAHIEGFEAHKRWEATPEGQEAMRQKALAYLGVVKHTYLENWPDALHSLSVASTRLPLTLADAEALGASNGEYAGCFPEPHPRDLSELEARIDAAATAYPDGFFVRLGSRSPKDTFAAHRYGFKCRTGLHALALLCGSSERLYEDLHLAVKTGYEPSIWLRQWIDIEPWREWRCFLRGGRLAGVSQYNHFDCHESEIKRDIDSIKWVLPRWVADYFVPAWGRGDVVFDVVLKRREHVGEDRMRESENSIILLEVNPHTNMTDPCLFNWNKPGEFRGQLRYKCFSFQGLTEPASSPVEEDKSSLGYVQRKQKTEVVDVPL